MTGSWSQNKLEKHAGMTALKVFDSIPTCSLKEQSKEHSKLN